MGKIKLTYQMLEDNVLQRRLWEFIRCMPRDEVEDIWLSNEDSSTQLRETIAEIISRAMCGINMRSGTISLDGDLGLHLTEKILNHFKFLK